MDSRGAPLNSEKQDSSTKEHFGIARPVRQDQLLTPITSTMITLKRGFPHQHHRTMNAGSPKRDERIHLIGTDGSGGSQEPTERQRDAGSGRERDHLEERTRALSCRSLAKQEPPEGAGHVQGETRIRQVQRGRTACEQVQRSFSDGG